MYSVTRNGDLLSRLRDLSQALSPFRSLTWSVIMIQTSKTLKYLLRPIQGLRNYSEQIAVATRDGSSNPAQQVPRPKLVQYPYYVPRNARGSLPVYSDIRNNGTRVLVLIRNVEGNVEVSAQAISFDIFLYIFMLMTCAAHQTPRRLPRTLHPDCLKKGHPTPLV